MKFLFLAFLPLSALAVTPASNVSSCDSVAKEKCFEFRGRAISAMGRAGTRVWKIGSKHLYEVQSQTEEAYTDLKRLDFHNKIYADFKGCPVEPFKKGAMQGICIESLKNVKTEIIP